MRSAIDETDRRRKKQHAHNQAHNIEPRTIIKEVRDLTSRLVGERQLAEPVTPYVSTLQLPRHELDRLLEDLQAQMQEAAQALEFEKAAALRDQIIDLRQRFDE
jgi:excinuclease ABC subunit B